MRFAIFTALTLVSQTGCGLLIDGGYLISGPRYTTSTEQRRPTGQSQTDLERDLRFENGRLVLSCQEVTRGLDRVWHARKEYEYQGGIYQAHWLPILVEGVIGAGVAIGIGTQCSKPGSDFGCGGLYYTIPLGVDVAYSAVRLLTIDKPKLVGKSNSAPWTAPHSDPQAVRPVACEPNSSLIVGTYAEDPRALRLRFDAQGALSPDDQKRALRFLADGHGTRIFLVPGGEAAVEARTKRCELLRLALQLGLPDIAHGLGPECPMPPPQ